MTGGIQEPVQDKPEGIGGWLILPMLGFALVAVSTPVLVYRDANALTAGLWTELRELHPIIFFVILGVAALSLLQAVLAGGTLVLIFVKDRRAPIAAIIFLATEAALAVFEWLTIEPMVWRADMPELEDLGWRRLPNALPAAVIWIPYFLVSRRVKNTFKRGA